MPVWLRLRFFKARSIYILSRQCRQQIFAQTATYLVCTAALPLQMEKGIFSQLPETAEIFVIPALVLAVFPG